jgi:pimeloyl-ACP methyl ester carboxylesterase
MDVRRPGGGTIAVELVGSPTATPVLFCHGLAESRLAAHRLAPAAEELGLRVIAPDRPGTGRSTPQRLGRVVDWVTEATTVLDALGIETAHLLGISGGGAFAAACAARRPERFPRLVLVAPLGPPAWSTRGMEPWQRRSLRLGTVAPGFGGWFMARLAALERHAPRLYHQLVTAGMPATDRRFLAEPAVWEDFRSNYQEAFRQGGVGVGQDLRVLRHPWGFDLSEVAVPTVLHHGDADTTVPLAHGRRYAATIPHARLELHPGHGHFSLPARVRGWPELAG